MIQGIVIQAVQTDAAKGADYRVARQAIIIPADRSVWYRNLSHVHPKGQWKRHYHAVDYAAPFHDGRIQSAFSDFGWEARHDARWHLTDRPLGIQITDDEYLSLKGGDMPRNVALRANRVITARKGAVVGADAVPDPRAFMTRNIVRLARLPEATVAGRLERFLALVQEAVDSHDTMALNSITPNVGRARGAGPHRNGSDLPDGVAPVAAPVAETPAPPPIVVPVVKTAPGAVLPGAKIVAADGQVYVARKVDSDEKNLSDVELFRRAYADSMNVLLLGEPGTGKTRGLLAAFPDAIVVSVTGDTEVADLIGSYVPTGPDSFAWVDGPLVQGMDEGRMVIMDEIGLADSKVLSVLYSLMDKKGTARKLLVTANPARGTVVAKDGFGIAGTTNPNSKGVHIAEPLLSRCAIAMTVTTDYKVARALGCNERLVQAAEHLAKQRANGEVGWAPEMRNLLDAKQIEEKFGLTMALRALIMQAPEMEREVVEIQLRERFGDLPGAARKIKALGV